MPLLPTTPLLSAVLLAFSYCTHPQEFLCVYPVITREHFQIRCSNSRWSGPSPHSNSNANVPNLNIHTSHRITVVTLSAGAAEEYASLASQLKSIDSRASIFSWVMLFFLPSFRSLYWRR